MWFSFKSDVKLQAVRKVTRRIIDATASRYCGEDNRVDSRSARHLPALVAPYSSETGSVGAVATAITKDISDTGMSLLVSKELTSAEVVIAVVFDNEPKCFLGTIRQNRSFGAGFWLIGADLNVILDPREDVAVQCLLPLVPCLSAPCGEPATPSP